MAALDNHILTIIEPTIKLDQVQFDSFNEGEGNEKANTSKDYLVVVSINGYTFKDTDIKSMILKLDSKVPTIELILIDSQANFQVDTYPRDGDVINVRIGARQKEVYKDIRIDFDIIRVNSPNTSPQEPTRGTPKYSISGRMKVPGLYADVSRSYGKGTSLDHVESIATDLELGLATNIDSTDDEMNLFIAYDSINDTLDDLVRHSYISDDSFQTYSIDPYYYINYVDMNKLMQSEETLEDALAALDIDVSDQLLDTDTDASNNMKHPLILSTHRKYIGTSFHITNYSLKNRAGGNAIRDGYKRTLKFYENDSDEGLVSFDMEPLSSAKMADIEEPLKGRRGEDRYLKEVKTKYIGRKNADPETTNIHLNYEFSAISNDQNLKELNKMTLEVELSSFNPGIHRYQKIPIIIFKESAEEIGADKVIKDKKAEQGFDTAPDGERDYPQTGDVVADEFLSGYYVVGDIQYVYKSGNSSVSQKLTLLRREWPSRTNNINEETVAPTPSAPPPPPPPPPPAEPVTQPTPVDAVMGEWSEWGSCEDGQQTRTREVLEPAQNGGATGELEETQECTVGKYTYIIEDLGFEKQIVVFENNTEVFRGQPSLTAEDSVLVQEAKNNLDPTGSDSDVQNMQRK